MGAIDYDNRWIYLGSSTLPPCSVISYWNIVHSVYPIELKYIKIIDYMYKQNNDQIQSETNTRMIMRPVGN